METITIKDIAKALNLSTSTVSRALRGSYEINEETKRQVIEYAEKLNYRPNPIALSLKENRSRAIGVVVPEIANNFFSQTINGIEAIAYNRGYHVVIFQSHESYEREVVNIEHLVARKVDGLLISLSSQTTDVSHLAELHEKGLPVVFFDRVTDKIETSKVVADNFKGAFVATEHLIMIGRKNIAHFTGSPWVSVTQERMAGYKAALEKYNLPIQESLVRHYEFGTNEAKEVVFEILSNDPRPDAIIVSRDKLTLSCLAALKEKKVRIPEDIALVGFTNLSVADLLDPPLTTVCQPAFEIGQTAVELLLDLIEKKQNKIQYRTVKLSIEMTIRESSVKIIR